MEIMPLSSPHPAVRSMTILLAGTVLAAAFLLPPAGVGGEEAKPGQSGDAGSRRAWLVGRNGVRVCMAVLPEGWNIEGNVVVNERSLSFQGLLWLRFFRDGDRTEVSLVQSIGDGRTSAYYDRTRPRDLWTPETYVPFHRLARMSAWQMLGIYVKPLAMAVHPGCVAGDIRERPDLAEGHDPAAIPAAEISFTYRKKGAGIEETVVLSPRNWYAGRKPPRLDHWRLREMGERLWDAERFLIISRPEGTDFSEADAERLLAGINFAPGFPPALIAFVGGGWTSIDEEVRRSADEIRALAAEAREGASALVAVGDDPDALPKDGYLPLPVRASVTVPSGRYGLANALAELFMIAPTLYPDYAIPEWLKIGRVVATDAATPEPE